MPLGTQTLGKVSSRMNDEVGKFPLGIHKWRYWGVLQDPENKVSFEELS